MDERAIYVNTNAHLETKVAILKAVIQLMDTNLHELWKELRMGDLSEEDQKDRAMSIFDLRTDVSRIIAATENRK